MAERLPDLEQLAADGLFHRALALPYRSQLALYDLLTERFREAGRAPTKHDERATRQREALGALQAVADSLALPEGQAPTSGQFSAECKRLGIEMNVTTVGRAFNGWRNATVAFKGGRVPEGARLIRQRRTLRGIQGHSPADLLAHVAEWVESEECREHTPGDYEQWRRRYNERAVATDARLAVGWEHLSNKVFPALTTEDIIAAARGEVEDWSALCRQRAEESLVRYENPLNLVSYRTAAALLGTTHYAVTDAIHANAGFPTVIAELGVERLLYADDVRRYGAGEQPPAREFGELTNVLLNLSCVARILGRPRRAVQSAMAREAWHSVPVPKGRTQKQAYWLRADVEAWSPPQRRSR